MKKHIIFDYNGTLLDDVCLGHYVMTIMLSDRNLPNITYERYKEILRFPIKEYYILAGIDFDKYSFDDMAIEFHKLYNNNFHMTEIHKGAIDALEYFKNNGYTQSILSAAPIDTLKQQLEDFNMLHYFSTITGANNDKAHGKTQQIKEHLEKISKSGDEVIYIGDTKHDFEVANAINCPCMLVTFGHQNIKRLKALNVPLANNFDDIIKFVELQSL